MNGKKVFDSLEGIEDEYILEAAPGQHKKRAGTLRVVALAAAAAILISAIPFGVWMAKRRKAAPSVTEDESYYAPYYEDEAYYEPYYNDWENFDPGDFALSEEDHDATLDQLLTNWSSAFKIKRPQTRGELLRKATPYKRTGFALNADGESYTWYGPAQGQALESINVPSEHKGKPVTAIGKLAFLDCTVGKVTIPEGIVRIEKGAFYLTSVTETLYLPESLREVQLSSFSSLSGFTYENGAVYCASAGNPYFCLLSMNKDADGVIHGDCRVIAKEVYAAGTVLESLAIPAHVRYINSGAFKSTRRNFQTITVDEHNENYELKSGCLVEKDSGRLIIALPGAEIPRDGSIRVICEGAFLVDVPQNLDVPAGVVSIEDYAFKNNEAGERVLRLPEGLTSIGNRAFSGIQIKEVVLPSSVTYVGDEVFGNNGVLEKFVLSDQLEYFGRAGDLCYYLRNNHLLKTTLRDHVHYLGSEKNPYILVLCTDGEAAGEIVLPEGVKLIGFEAFKGCREITGIRFPEGLLMIAESAFESCFGGGDSATASIVLPKSLKSIGEKAFSYAFIAEVQFLCGVATIPERAFFHTYLTGELIIPEGTVFIGVEAFSIGSRAGDEQITALSLPSTLRAVGASAFADCAFTELKIPANLSYIGSYAFRTKTSITLKNEEIDRFYGEFVYFDGTGDRILGVNTTSLTKITVAKGNKTYFASGNCLIEKASGTLILGCNNSVIPDDGSVHSIGTGAFSCCLLENFVLPEGIVSIGSSAFSSCRKLSITLPKSLKTIRSWAFASSALRSIVLPEGLTEIGEYAFYFTTALKEIEIPGSVKKLSDYAFDGSKLCRVILHEGLEEIGNAVFYMCPIEEVALPESLKTIKQIAFVGSKLTSLYIPAGVTDIFSEAFSCKHLESITVSPDNPCYYSVDGCLLSRSGTLLLGSKNAVIPQDGSVRSIARSAFTGIEELTRVVIPEGVTAIESSFQNCSNLRTVVLPASVMYLGDSAFGYNTDLTILYRGSEAQWKEIKQKNNALKGVKEIVYDYTGE